MQSLTSICVFCGSGSGENPEFEEAAIALGKDLAAHNVRLVYGGGSTGLMGAVARSVLKSGGSVTGVIPDFLVKKEIKLDGADEMIVTKNMHERKMIMFEKADAFVALPGGVGTLEELIEQMTWLQLGQHNKPILVANIADFWTPLKQLLDQMSAQKFIRDGLLVDYLMTSDATQIVPMIKDHMEANDIVPSSVVEKM